MVEKAERRSRLIAFVRQAGNAHVSDLAVALGVATETVRRDLSFLEEEGLVRRTHGSVHPVDNASFETSLAYRSNNMVPEKRRIAAATTDLMRLAGTAYLDDGFTPALIAERLVSDGHQLTVITPSIPVATILAKSGKITTIVIGGVVRPSTLGTVGHWAVELLADITIDIAVLGTNGISVERGLTTPDPEVSALKAAVLARSVVKIAIGIHTKFGVESFARFAELSDLDTVVTDSGLRRHEAERFQEKGPNILRV